MFPTSYQTFQYIAHYARWRHEDNRRERWPETVERYITFFSDLYPQLEKYTPGIYARLGRAIRELNVMPSMRALWTAGPALAQDNAAGYNCAFVRIDQPYKFAEVMYNSLCGVGVGFSVERQFINNLPEIPDEVYQSETRIVVEDSKLGWSSALRELISMLYAGQIPVWDLSRLRPAGAPLKTFGGRASGPQPLDALFRFCVDVFTKARGRKLHSLECHDIVCKIGQAVVSGGVRRSALISLSNLSDDRMRGAKTGDWRSIYPHRELANNSAVYTERPDMEVFMKEWWSLFESKSGERGIYNVAASRDQAASTGRREWDYHFGTNPCCEIILRDQEFCNLTEVVCRANDDWLSLKRKVILATILGTLQSTLTSFRFLSRGWKRNCEEERLLGVSLTGIFDNPYLNGVRRYVPMDWTTDEDWHGDNSVESLLRNMRRIAVETNEEYARELGINQSVAVTCVKPSGTVSQVVNSSAGIHPRWSQYYMRGVVLDKYDPLYQYMRDAGFPCEDSEQNPKHSAFVRFPMSSNTEPGLPDRNSLSALEHLRLWLMYQTHWCEHKPSCTILVRNEEWLEVGAWVYRHFDRISGLSFFPHSELDTVYNQLPYRECTEAEYRKALERFPIFNQGDFERYEKVDNTIGAQELACSSGQCEL